MTTSNPRHLTTAPIATPGLAPFAAPAAHPLATLSVINVPAPSSPHRTGDICP
jgi:hypothetical protein